MSVLKNAAADLQASTRMAYATAMNRACNSLEGIELCDAATQAADAYKASQIIEVEVKSVYGNTLIYPANDAAKTLARIAGTKTLSVADLQNASQLGLEVVEINRNYGPISDLASFQKKAA